MRLILITLFFIETAEAFQKDETELGLIPPTNLEFPSKEDPALQEGLIVHREIPTDEAVPVVVADLEIFQKTEGE